ncbi:TRAP transporter small permease [Azospirillum sp. RWY-5-1]|uniref:TRAP transporter small permease protein n=1 Tax=Azospirillum oleiclasticum TaxID=2735135 RepID=A0ABX2TCL5_9PROT|nr:TRAP transporter small permease [Azospirillum oleiclasticum]NYZ14051.1 TRAP transporter small permease [Azospirillum oleiclasticum]NYZ21535.1 TRAP transporter small permease [Azospirillum oleiclasticum]
MGGGRRAAERAVAVLDGIAAAVGWIGVALAAAGLLASLALVGYSVAMRYFLNMPVPWTDELVGYLLVAIVMLAAADSLRRGEHIGVDVLTERLGERGRRITAAFGLLSVLVTGAALAVDGWDTVAFTKMLGILSTGYLQMPMHIPQALVPIGGALLALAALAGLARMAVGRPPLEDGGGHGVLPPSAKAE